LRGCLGLPYPDPFLLVVTCLPLRPRGKPGGRFPRMASFLMPSRGAEVHLQPWLPVDGPTGEVFRRPFLTREPRAAPLIVGSHVLGTLVTPGRSFQGSDFHVLPEHRRRGSPENKPPENPALPPGPDLPVLPGPALMPSPGLLPAAGSALFPSADRGRRIAVVFCKSLGATFLPVGGMARPNSYWLGSLPCQRFLL
jgi:hypothetical protein